MLHSFGREQERLACLELLARPDCQLLTLVGIGGIGKTHLAAQIMQQFDGDTFWISLTNEKRDFWSDLASVLPIENTPLLDYLREQRLLLVLDGTENTDPAQISMLLAAAPQLKILATSRVALGLKAEWLRPVIGLDEISAEQLFIARATQVCSSPTANRPMIQALCHQVDGHPLAIELLASWRKTLTCQAIWQQLHQNLDMLTAAWQDTPIQQQSMLAIWNWTWQRLSPAKQNLLQNLTVFRRYFDYTAAIEIACATPRLLQNLVDQGLVVANERYCLPSLIRQYALTTMTPEQVQTLSVRYSAYYMRLLQGLESDLKQRHQQTAIATIEQAWEDIQAVCQPPLESCIESLLLFFTITGRIQAGEGFFRQRWQQTHAPDRARLIAAWIQLITWEGQLATTEDVDMLLAECPPDGYTWRSQAHVSIARKQFTEALGYLERSQTFFQHEPYQQVQLLRLRAYCYSMMHQSQLTRTFLSESLRLAQQLDDQVGIAAALLNLGMLAFESDDVALAEQHWRAALAIQIQIGNGGRVVYCAINLAALLRRQARQAEAAHLLDSLSAYVEAGSLTERRYQRMQAALTPNMPEKLSQREQDVLHLIAQGLSNEAISARLMITVGTTKIHIHRIFGKLQVKNRVQALTKARQLGLL